MSWGEDVPSGDLPIDRGRAEALGERFPGWFSPWLVQIKGDDSSGVGRLAAPRTYPGRFVRSDLPLPIRRSSAILDRKLRVSGDCSE